MGVEKMSVSFDLELGEAIRAAATVEDRSVSAWLADAARDRLRRVALGEAVHAWERRYGKLTESELTEANAFLQRDQARPAARCALSLLLDSGALVAFERGDRKVAALVEAARSRRDAVVTSSGCVAQAWRGGGPRRALLARLLRGVDERPLAPGISRVVGELCGRNDTSDVVDAHVALLASDLDVVVTSDPGDLSALLTTRRSRAQVFPC